MRTACFALGVAAILGLGTWVGTSLWGQSAEEPSPTERPTRAPTPRRAEAPGLDKLRQQFRRMSPAQKAAALRELVAALREDLVQRQRDAAHRRFAQADADKDGKLTFEEAWQAGLFRPGASQRRGELEPGAPSGPRERLRRAAPLGNESQAGGGPRTQRREVRAPDFPRNELEEQLLESWELLQELDVLSHDAGE